MTNRMINILAFIILALLWLAFGLALLFNRTALDNAWQTFRSWPLLLQIIVGLLILPVTLGLWIWEASWPLWLRLLLVLGLGVATIYVFLPKRTTNQPETTPKP